MNATPTLDPISKHLAFHLCAEIRRINQKKHYSFACWQCWGCMHVSQGNPDKMCLTSRPGYRGCQLVNMRYEQLHEQPVAV